MNVTSASIPSQYEFSTRAQATAAAAVTPARTPAAEPVADKGQPAAGSTVQISALGKSLADAVQANNPAQGSQADGASASDVRERQKEAIRELKEKLREQQVKLAQVLADRSLSPEARRAEASKINQAIASLSATLQLMLRSLESSRGVPADTTGSQTAPAQGAV